MANDDPAAIARRLSPAQRRALLALPADGQPRIGWPGGTNTLHALLRMRLVARWCVTASAEDLRARGNRHWHPDDPSSIRDAYSLTVERYGWGAGVHDRPCGCDVRAVLEREARDGADGGGGG